MPISHGKAVPVAAEQHGKIRVDGCCCSRTTDTLSCYLAGLFCLCNCATLSEITNKSNEQRVAEAEVDSFLKSLGPFVFAAETTRMAMVFTDAKEPDNPIIFANDSFISLTGYSREEVLGQSFNFLMAHGADAEALAQIESEFKSVVR
jgi:PAS domain-containing protein